MQSCNLERFRTNIRPTFNLHYALYYETYIFQTLLVSETVMNFIIYGLKIQNIYLFKSNKRIDQRNLTFLLISTYTPDLQHDV